MAVSDFLQNMMQMLQVKNAMNQVAVQQQQAAEQRRQGTIRGYAEFISQLENLPDPAAADKLQEAYAAMGLDNDALGQLRSGVTPGEGVLGRGASQRGMSILNPEESAEFDRSAAITATTGMRPGEQATDSFLESVMRGSRENMTPAQQSVLEDALRIRVASGMGPGDLATQNATAAGVAGMMPQEFVQGERIRRGLAPDAQSYAQNELQWARLRQDERLTMTDQALREVLGMEGLALDRERLAIARRQAQAAGGVDPVALSEELGKNLRSLYDSRVAHRSMEVATLTNLINTQMDQLTKMGMLAPRGFLPDGTPVSYRIEAGDVAPRDIFDMLQRRK